MRRHRYVYERVLAFSVSAAAMCVGVSMWWTHHRWMLPLRPSESAWASVGAAVGSVLVLSAVIATTALVRKRRKTLGRSIYTRLTIAAATLATWVVLGALWYPARFFLGTDFDATLLVPGLDLLWFIALPSAVALAAAVTDDAQLEVLLHGRRWHGPRRLRVDVREAEPAPPAVVPEDPPPPPSVELETTLDHIRIRLGNLPRGISAHTMTVSLTSLFLALVFISLAPVLNMAPVLGLGAFVVFLVAFATVLPRKRRDVCLDPSRLSLVDGGRETLSVAWTDVAWVDVVNTPDQAVLRLAIRPHPDQPVPEEALDLGHVWWIPIGDGAERETLQWLATLIQGRAPEARQRMVNPGANQPAPTPRPVEPRRAEDRATPPYAPEPHELEPPITAAAAPAGSKPVRTDPKLARRLRRRRAKERSGRG